MEDRPPSPAPQRHRRRLRRWLLIGVAVFVVLVVADLAWAGVRAVDGFTQARDDLSEGGAALEAGRLDEARNLFGAASTAATDAQSAMSQPAVRLLGLVPGAHANVDALSRAAKATGYAAAGGTSYADAAEAAGWDGSTIPGFAPGGHLDASIIQAAAPQLEEAATQLGMARDELAPIDPSKLAGPLRDPIEQAKSEIDTRAEQAGVAAGLANLLPSFLGATSPQTYLLVTMTPADPRAGGGYPGVMGLLHFDGKQLSLSKLQPTSQVPGVPRVPGPADVKRSWGWTGIDRFFWDTAYTPDFPTVAGFMKKIWEAGGGQPVDGVIAGDPALMSELLGVVGSVSTPAWPETIDATNVERIVEADAYRTQDNNESDRWQVGIGEALWSAVLTRPWPLQPMASAVAQGVDGGHLRVWSSDATEEAQLTDLGVAGNFVAPPDGSADIRLNGILPNRVGYFIDRQVTTEHGVDDQGRPTTTVTVTLRNHAPASGPSVLLGLNKRAVDGKAYGTFGGEVMVYTPANTHGIVVMVDGHHTSAIRWHEFGVKGVRVVTDIQPGDSSTMTVTYSSGSRPV
jgi:hypothetical protein